jgi:hypothetical protein
MRIHFINTFSTISAWFLCTIINVYAKWKDIRTKRFKNKSIPQYTQCIVLHTALTVYSVISNFTNTLIRIHFINTSSTIFTWSLCTIVNVCIKWKDVRRKSVKYKSIPPYTQSILLLTVFTLHSVISGITNTLIRIHFINTSSTIFTWSLCTIVNVYRKCRKDVRTKRFKNKSIHAQYTQGILLPFSHFTPLYPALQIHW